MDDVIRDALGRFQPGTAPGPGRTIGSRSRLVTALRQALDEDSTLEKLRDVAIEADRKFKGPFCVRSEPLCQVEAGWELN